ncbi:thiamine phosphate synthase [Cyclobacterium jeungdonense]|uniref:Thiamine phosphate synthase n=1 Tax=Cyclobacterium jeungdonense TaxID=708087 RepID=A0ABT8C2F6_9BACT|nr:thiamine phosphate synthase [Cyclobacterium jeungdonense]MDN3686217.1 thiamine phosphate synthase [Cyclobacterium jeungdonense]
MKTLNLRSEKGIYLVLDPRAKSERELFQDLKNVFQYPLIALQIWDNFGPELDIHKFIGKVCEMARPYSFPVLIANSWEWVGKTELDGVHFDQIPENFAQIRKRLPENLILGLTCTNDLSLIAKAEENGFDYISFCSVFPSPNAEACDLVSKDTLRKAAECCNLPFFLAGGIRPENVNELDGIPHRGLALISGIMGQTNPEKAMEQFTNLLQTNK